ncbi:MAG: exodeoxyribonuclease V subunit gamma, partial [Actinobacteria bacterium]|nr:exodeoxyribonuclease V subunit gamma [Actinomycetota bacterium]
DMIESVTFEKTTYAQLPNKFEAGTPDIAGAIGLGAAIDYLTAVGFDAFHDHEQRLLRYATEQLAQIPGLRIIGAAKKKAGVISFVLEDPPLSAIDIGTRLDREGVAVRTGHHCCQPLMDRFKVPATVRASFALYNTEEDVDALVAALKKVRAESGSRPAPGPQRDDAAPAEVQFPDAAKASPDAAADELADVFEMLGDRDARSEDRQLLLDAVLAATDRLVVTYAGRDERTNAERPPAVPVGELLDVVDRTVRTEAGPGPLADGREQPASERVVVHHPLQPFDVRNFTAGTLVPGRPWSFDAVALDGARALSRKRPDEPPPPFLPARLPPAPGDVVELADLERFVQHPARAFLRQRLGISVADYSEDVDDALPVELGPLEQWGVGDRLLAARLAGAEPEACVAAEMARGILPPGALARPVLDRVCPTVEDLVAAATELTGGAGDPRSIEVALPLPDGRLLVGTVPGVRGTLAATVVYSRVGPKHRLASWARFLALTAASPDAGFEAATVGRRRADVRGRARVTIARIAAFGADGADDGDDGDGGDPEARRAQALLHLGRLVELYDRGMCEPLPLYCATSAAHASARAAGKDSKGAEAAARKVWESDWDFPREDKQDEHLLVLGGARPFGDLLEAPPGDDEQGEGWAGDEPTRFGRYARRLWDGLLEFETLVDR